MTREQFLQLASDIEETARTTARTAQTLELMLARENGQPETWVGRLSQDELYAAQRTQEVVDHERAFAKRLHDAALWLRSHVDLMPVGGSE